MDREELKNLLRPKKAKPKSVKKPDDVVTVVRSAMDEIKALLKQKPPVEFRVTERDAKGKIKTFTVT